MVLLHNAGETTVEGRLRLQAPEQTVQVPMAGLQPATASKGDNVRVMSATATTPAGYTALFAQVIPSPPWLLPHAALRTQDV